MLFRSVAATCAGYAGSCEFGELIDQDDRRMENHCDEDECDDGYTDFDDATKTCVAWEGDCANGELRDQDKRTAPSQCGSCAAGYKLVGIECIAFGGSCVSGALFVEQEDRLKDDDCGSCNGGYDLRQTLYMSRHAGACPDGSALDESAAMLDQAILANSWRTGDELASMTADDKLAAVEAEVGSASALAAFPDEYPVCKRTAGDTIGACFPWMGRCAIVLHVKIGRAHV